MVTDPRSSCLDGKEETAVRKYLRAISKSQICNFLGSLTLGSMFLKTRKITVMR